MIKLLALLFTFAVIAPTMGMAQTTPITVTVIQEMNFGEFIPRARGDNIRLRPNGNLRTNSNTITLGGHQVAIFEVAGEPRSSVTLSITDPGQLTGPGSPMILNDFRSRPNFFTGRGLQRAGVRQFSLGAAFQVPEGQMPGVYTGSYVITLEYQ